MRGKVAVCVWSLVATAGVGLVPAAATGTAAPQRDASSASLNACKLLTTAEVVKVIGEPVARTQGGASGTGAKYCHWYGADSHLLQRGISVIAASNYARQRYKLYKQQLHANTPVSGVGDVAATDGQTLITRVGHSRFLFISPLYNNTGITVDQLKPLARKALGRIH